MEVKHPVCLGQDTILPSQNLQPDVKNLLLTLLRIKRAIALQVWRMERCKRYAHDYAFQRHLARLVDELGCTMLALDAATHKDVA